MPILPGWDDNGYYAWARSITVDDDADFSNDFEFLEHNGDPRLRADYFNVMHQNPRTDAGRIPNKYAIGLPMLSLPLMYAAHFASNIYETVSGIKVSPFAAIYQLAFIFTSVIAGFAGVAFCYRLAARRTGRHAALISCATGFLGLSTGFYIWFGPTMAHAASFGTGALFTVAAAYWFTRLRAAMRSGEIRHIAPASLMMGLAFGVSCTMRFPLASFVVVPVVLAFEALRRSRTRNTRRWLILALASLAIAGAGTLIGFMPQLCAWKLVYGSWHPDTYTGEKVGLLPVHALSILFGSRNGLFYWTPLALCAVLGLIRAAVRGDALARAGCACLLCATWLYGGWQSFGMGHSFGMRGFVDVSVFLFYGLAQALAWVGQVASHRLRSLMYALPAVLVVWNVMLISAFRIGIIPHGKPLIVSEVLLHARECKKQAATDAKDIINGLRREKYPLFTPDTTTPKIPEGPHTL